MPYADGWFPASAAPARQTRQHAAGAPPDKASAAMSGAAARNRYRGPPATASSPRKPTPLGEPTAEQRLAMARPVAAQPPGWTQQAQQAARPSSSKRSRSPRAARGGDAPLRAAAAPSAALAAAPTSPRRPPPPPPPPPARRRVARHVPPPTAAAADIVGTARRERPAHRAHASLLTLGAGRFRQAVLFGGEDAAAQPTAEAWALPIERILAAAADGDGGGGGGDGGEVAVSSVRELGEGGGGVAEANRPVGRRPLGALVGATGGRRA